MERIAKFHKVSYEQFEGDWKDTFGPIETEEIRRIYEGIFMVSPGRMVIATGV